MKALDHRSPILSLWRRQLSIIAIPLYKRRDFLILRVAFFVILISICHMCRKELKKNPSRCGLQYNYDGNGNIVLLFDARYT